MGKSGFEKGRGGVDVFEDFEYGEDVVFLGVGGGEGEVFDRAVEVFQPVGLGEERVGAGVGFRDRDDGGGGVDGCDVTGVGEAGGGGGEDAAAAADVEIAVFLLVLLWPGGGGGEEGWGGVCFSLAARGDEVVAEGVHQVEEAGRAVGIPPGGSEAGEVRDLGGGDGRGGGGRKIGG